MSQFTFHILTVSDTCSLDASQDKSGPLLESLLKKTFPDCVTNCQIVSDNLDEIVKVLIYQCDDKKCNGIFTTGGTGFSQRDVTPEATKQVIHKDTPGITTAMTVGSLQATPMAMLSRATSGIRNGTLIVNLPGSVKAVGEIYKIIEPCLDHALSLLIDDQRKIKMEHKTIQGHVKSNVDISKVALRSRESEFPMIQVREALEIIENHYPSYGSVPLPVEESLHHFLAEVVVAKVDLPPYPVSMKDGYACISSDTILARKVICGVRAGDEVDYELRSGECVRINTGAPIPNGADCVVQVEDTMLLEHSVDGSEEYEIQVKKLPKKGQDVRAKGFDVKRGTTFYESNTFIDTAMLGVLISFGYTKVNVVRKPIFGIISTGNELTSHHETNTNSNCIIDTNRPMLKALLKKHFAQYIDYGIVKDNPDDLKKVISKALNEVDIIIATGSVSMGDHDMMKPVLVQDFNAKIHFGRVNMKPGKPTTFVTLSHKGEEKLIFALPGNPLSAFVTFNLFILPCVKQTLNEKYSYHQLNKQIGLNLDPRPEYVPVVLKYGKIDVEKLRTNRCSSSLSHAVGANALVRLPGREVGNGVLTGSLQVIDI